MKNLLFGHFLANFKDVGLLLMRIGLGFGFAFVHGRQKLFGGSGTWEAVGGRATSLIGMADTGFIATLLGLIASVTEFAGGLFLMVGLLTRPTALLLAITMAVAFLTHIAGDGIAFFFNNPMGGSWAFELMFVFVGLMILGAGRISLDYMITKKA